MSWLSQATGIHLSPHGASLSRPDPIGAIKTAVSNPLFDGALALGLPGVGSVLGGLGSAIGGAASAIPGVSAIGGALGGIGSAIGGAASAIPGVSSIEGLLGKGGASALGGAIPDSAMGLGGGGSGLLSGAEQFLTGNGGRNLLGLAQGVNAAQLGQKSNSYANDALNSAQNAYNEKAGIRQQALNGLQNPTAPDLSNLSKIASSIPQLPQNYAGSATTADPSKLQPFQQLPFAGNVPTSVPNLPNASPMSIEQLQQFLTSGRRF